MLSTKRSLLPLMLVLCLAALSASDACAAGKSPAQKKKQAQMALIGLLTLLPAAAIIALGGLGLQTAYRATFVKRSDRVAKAASGGPVKCFALGLVNSALLFVLIAVTGDAVPAATLVLILLSGLLLFMGLAAKAENLGARVALVAGYECNPVIGLVIGWPTIVCILLVPVVGWWVVLYLAVAGVGAVVLSFLGNGRTATVEEQEANGSPAGPDDTETDCTETPQT